MQRGNRCYRRASTCETAAVNKGFVRRYYIGKYVFTHGHTVTIITIKRCWDILINKFYLGSCYPLRSCGFFSNSLFPLTWLFKRKFFRSSFLEKVFFEKISDTTMCTWKTPPPLTPSPSNTCKHDSTCMAHQVFVYCTV